MTIFDFLFWFLDFLNEVIMPLIIGIAFFVFLWNALRFFFFQGASEEGRTKAKRLMLWGFLAFIFIVSIWGITNVLVYGAGFDFWRGINPDYIQNGYFGGGQTGQPSGPGAPLDINPRSNNTDFGGFGENSDVFGESLR